MRCYFKHFCRSSSQKSTAENDNVSMGSQKRRDVGQSYVEHQLSLEELCDIYAGNLIIGRTIVFVIFRRFEVSHQSILIFRETSIESPNL